MTREELEAIEKRERAAAAGPWRTGPLGRHVQGTAVGAVVSLCDSVVDAAFIAAARSDVPALLAEVRRLREVCSNAADELDTLPHNDARDVMRKLREAVR